MTTNIEYLEAQDLEYYEGRVNSALQRLNQLDEQAQQLELEMRQNADERDKINTVVIKRRLALEILQKAVVTYRKAREEQEKNKKQCPYCELQTNAGNMVKHIRAKHKDTN